LDSAKNAIAVMLWAYRVARSAFICEVSSDVSEIDRIATATSTSSKVKPGFP
jgi:hypothetical protein